MNAEHFVLWMQGYVDALGEGVLPDKRQWDQRRDIREAAQQYTTEALATLAHVMRAGESEQARVAAANALLDRGYGKPSQHVTAETTTTIKSDRIDPTGKRKRGTDGVEVN